MRGGTVRRGFLQAFGLWLLSVLRPGMSRAAATAPAEPDDDAFTSTNLLLASLSDSDLAERRVQPVDIGDVVITSGRIRACDPLAYPDFSPLARSVPPGHYPVRIYFALGRVAAAMMRFAPGVPATWESARVTATPDYKAMPQGGYPVDAGMGAYMDADALAQMGRRIDKVKADTGSDSVNYYDDVVAEEVEAHDGEWTLHQPMPDNALNAAIFHSGWGDGYYPVLWGLSADGQPLVLLTDFFVIADADGRKEPE